MEIIIKLDHDEPVKVNTASIYGEQHPLPDWDPDKLREDLQDLKLENDRLQQREKLYHEFLNFFDCRDRTCVRCSHYFPEKDVPCRLALINYRHNLIDEFKQKLENL